MDQTIADDMLHCLRWCGRYRKDVLKMLGGVTHEEANAALDHLLETGQARAIPDNSGGDFDVITTIPADALGPGCQEFPC